MYALEHMPETMEENKADLVEDAMQNIPSIDLSRFCHTRSPPEVNSMLIV